MSYTCKALRIGLALLNGNLCQYHLIMFFPKIDHSRASVPEILTH